MNNVINDAIIEFRNKNYAHTTDEELEIFGKLLLHECSRKFLELAGDEPKWMKD